MPYCRKCNLEVVFGEIDPAIMDEIECEIKNKGRKVMFAGCCVVPWCPKCNSTLEEMKEFEDDE